MLYQYLHLFFRHGLPETGREYGPMRDLPDWSYAGNKKIVY